MWQFYCLWTKKNVSVDVLNEKRSIVYRIRLGSVGILTNEIKYEEDTGNLKRGTDMTLANKMQLEFSRDQDYISRRLLVGDDVIVLLGLRSLIDFPHTISMLRLQLIAEDISEHPFQVKLAGLGHALSETQIDEVIAEVQNGMLVAIHDASGTCVSIFPVPQTLSRAIESPFSENSVRGSSSAFNEDLQTNIGLLRKHLNASDLQTASFTFGTTVKHRLILTYLSGSISSVLLASITNALESHLTQDVSNLQELSKALGINGFTFITHYNTTDLPQNAAGALKKGKAVIFLDRFPFAIVLPGLASDAFMTEDDLNFPYLYMVLLRCLRLVGILITLIFPGLYVALVSVNPDVLRFELAHSIAKSRLDVPYPAVVETLLLLLVLELLLEAIIRLPSSTGPTVTMVGGIILGQAAVSAKLVSNLLIIILAAVTIASATIVGFQNSLSLRLAKYLLLFLSAFFGVMGLMSGLVVICSYLAGKKTLGVPYLQLKKPEGE